MEKDKQNPSSSCWRWNIRQSGSRIRSTTRISLRTQSLSFYFTLTTYQKAYTQQWDCLRTKLLSIWPFPQTTTAHKLKEDLDKMTKWEKNVIPPWKMQRPHSHKKTKIQSSGTTNSTTILSRMKYRLNT